MMRANDSRLIQQVRLIFSFAAVFVLSFFGVRQHADQRHAYDIFSVGVAHAEVPGVPAAEPATGATSSASCSTDAGAGNTGGTSGDAGGTGGSGGGSGSGGDGGSGDGGCCF